MNEPSIEALIVDLPGAERVREGLRDLAERRSSFATTWLQMASGRLREYGVDVPDGAPDIHLELFRNCVLADPVMGHATYRALNEELASFLDALAARRRRARVSGD